MKTTVQRPRWLDAWLSGYLSFAATYALYRTWLGSVPEPAPPTWTIPIWLFAFAIALWLYRRAEQRS